MTRPIIIPRFLRKGDTLGIVAPAGQLASRDTFAKAIHILAEMGFKVKFPRDLWPGAGYLADCDENRAQELHDLFRDNDVDGLLSLRGGFGCLRLLEHLDLELIRRNPKLIVGFSDITVLQNYLFKSIGLVSLHGPVLTSLPSLSEIALEKYYAALTGSYDTPVTSRELEMIKKGSDVRGIFIGGNLASLVSLLGTRYDVSWNERIVLLEDINEPLYKVDRMLTQLSHAGKFIGLKALLLGDFSRNDISVNRNDALTYKEQIWGRLLNLCEKESYPIWANIPSGHFAENFAMPLGLEVQLSHTSGEMRFLHQK